MVLYAIPIIHVRKSGSVALNYVVDLTMELRYVWCQQSRGFSRRQDSFALTGVLKKLVSPFFSTGQLSWAQARPYYSQGAAFLVMAYQTIYEIIGNIV